SILPTLSKRSLYGHAIGRMGSRSQWRKSRFHYRYAPVPHSVRADLRHFLFLGYFATTKTYKKTEGVVGGFEKGRQGGHGVWYLGHYNESRERDRDATDCRHDKDSDATGPDCTITRQ